MTPKNREKKEISCNKYGNKQQTKRAAYSRQIFNLYSDKIVEIVCRPGPKPGGSGGLWPQCGAAATAASILHQPALQSFRPVATPPPEISTTAAAPPATSTAAVPDCGWGWRRQASDYKQS